MERIPALAYLRVSGAGQVDGDGFPRQQAAIRRFAELRGYEVVREFEDPGVSGTTELTVRPGLTALLEHVRRGVAAVVIVEKVDRLARHMLASETILLQLHRAGARVLDAEGNDLAADDVNDDPQRVFFRQILVAAAQMDRRMIVTKLKAAKDRIRKETGRCEGAKPYGFYEHERPWLEYMRRLALGVGTKGKRRPTVREITRQLNSEGVPTRSGKPWSSTVVTRILERVLAKGDRS